MISTNSRRMISALAIAAGAAVAIVSPAVTTGPGEEAPENWPQFRGPSGAEQAVLDPRDEPAAA